MVPYRRFALQVERNLPAKRGPPSSAFAVYARNGPGAAAAHAWRAPAALQSASALRSVAGLVNTARQARREDRTRPRRHGVVRRTRCAARPRSFFYCVTLKSDVRSEALNMGKNECGKMRGQGNCARQAILSSVIANCGWGRSPPISAAAARSRASTACWKRIGRARSRSRSSPTRCNSRRWCRSAAGRVSAASPTSTERASNPFPGRRELARPPDIRGCSRPRTFRPFIRSWPRNRPPRSITSPVDASASTSSPAGISRRSKCSASRRWSTTPAMTARWNGSTSSSDFGPPQEEFDYEGRFYKVAKGWCMPKPIQQPYPVVMNAGGSERGTPLRGEILRRRVPQSRLERCRLHPQADRGLQGTGAPGIRPRDSGLEPCLYRAGRDRSGSKVVLQLLCAREGRLGGG